MTKKLDHESCFNRHWRNWGDFHHSEACLDWEKLGCHGGLGYQSYGEDGLKRERGDEEVVKKRESV